uniref:Uncharacterized protein n=1 Tax=Glossina brevipalpis TaxID=37001 RepID=A0A1A9WPA6_9MUSC
MFRRYIQSAKQAKMLKIIHQRRVSPLAGWLVGCLVGHLFGSFVICSVCQQKLVYVLIVCANNRVSSSSQLRVASKNNRGRLYHAIMTFRAIASNITYRLSVNFRAAFDRSEIGFDRHIVNKSETRKLSQNGNALYYRHQSTSNVNSTWKRAENSWLLKF